MKPGRGLWLLFGLAAGLFAVSRSRRGKAVLGDALDFVTVTAQRIGAALGDWTARIPVALRTVFAAAAARYSLPSGLLEAVAYRESRYRADIISGAYRSSAGAVGIMQIVPKWHPEVGEAGALDPAVAIPYAAKYLRQLHTQFGAWDLALAAYNWGPGNLKAWQTKGGNWPSETRTYVAEITRNAGLA